MGGEPSLLGRGILTPRRLALAALIIGLVIGIAAGRAWAALDTSPEQRRQASSTSNASAAEPQVSPYVAPEEPVTTTTTVDSAWEQLVALAGRIGRCEEPGSGWLGIDWTADGWTSAGHFAGGLGMRVDLYATLSGGHYAPNDPPEEQVRVFGIAWAQLGQRAWGCPG